MIDPIPDPDNPNVAIVGDNIALRYARTGGWVHFSPTVEQLRDADTIGYAPITHDVGSGDA